MLIVNSSQELDTRDRSVISVTWQWDYALASGTYPLFTIPDGYELYDAWNVTVQAHDGTPTATQGDSDDVDGYFDNTDLALGVAATAAIPAVKLLRNSGNPYANGKWSGTANVFNLYWTKGTNPTTGITKGGALLINPKKDGIPPDATSVSPV